MKRKLTFLQIPFGILALALVFVSCETEQLENETTQAKTELKEPPFKNYMVISETGQLSKRAQDELMSKGAEIIRNIPEIGITVIKSKDADFISHTKSQKNISVVPDYEIQWIPSGNLIKADAQDVGNGETYREDLWGMDAIDAPEAWNEGFLGNGASVFVLDSGIGDQHPDLAPNLNIDLSISFIEDEDWRSTANFNHGSHVSGTIAAAINEIGVVGVAPEAELVAVKVLAEEGSGSFSGINAGLVYAGLNGADVVNMSLGANINKNGWLTDADGNQYKIPAVYVQDLILTHQRAIDYAFKKGVTIIAAAGNEYHNADGDGSLIFLPAGLNNVIAVSATAPEGYRVLEDVNFDQPAHYSNTGYSLIDVAAPGGDFDFFIDEEEGIRNRFDFILSTDSQGYYWGAGTSQAAPHVSGVAALIIAANGGEMDPDKVVKQIFSTADHIDGNGQSIYYGHGRVNAYRAVTE